MQTTGRRLTKAQKDYDGFVAKFAKATEKTIDECLTPPAVYAAVLEWLTERRPDLAGREIVRPFFPGGDFENHDYPPGCAVVDNPPFSIYSRVVRFFKKRGIDFFLFGPGLTLFVEGVDCCYIPAGCQIRYANGAHINTGFVTNMLPGRILLPTSLRERLKQNRPRPKTSLPARMWTPARLGVLCRHADRDVTLGADDCTVPSKRGDAKRAFGGAVILSAEGEKMLGASGGN